MLWRLFAVACLAALPLGCGGDNARGINQDRDRPRSASEKDKAEKAEKAEKGKAEKGKAEKDKAEKK